MSILKKIKQARAECRASVETWKEYPILRCGGWVLRAEYNDDIVGESFGNGAVTLKEINAFKDDPVYSEATNFWIEGQYEAHSHISHYHEDFDINYDGVEYWSVDL